MDAAGVPRRPRPGRTARAARSYPPAASLANCGNWSTGSTSLVGTKVPGSSSGLVAAPGPPKVPSAPSRSPVPSKVVGVGAADRE